MNTCEEKVGKRYCTRCNPPPPCYDPEAADEDVPLSQVLCEHCKVTESVGYCEKVLFRVYGYWVDTKVRISALVYSVDEPYPDDPIDDEIFFYGLSEEDIKRAVESKKPVNDEFLLTEYYVI